MAKKISSKIGIWKDVVEDSDKPINKQEYQIYTFGDSIDEMFDSLGLPKSNDINDPIYRIGKKKDIFSEENLTKPHGAIVFTDKIGWGGYHESLENEMHIELRGEVQESGEDNIKKMEVMIYTQKSNKTHKEKAVNTTDFINDHEKFKKENPNLVSEEDEKEFQNLKQRLLETPLPEYNDIPNANHQVWWNLSDSDITIPKNCIEGEIYTRSPKDVAKAIAKNIVKCVKEGKK